MGLRYPRLSTFMYLGMGWLIVSPSTRCARVSPRAELALDRSPAACYTRRGVPFYVWKSRRYMHAVWHLFVLGGVACHFAAVLSVVGGPRRLRRYFLRRAPPVLAASWRSPFFAFFAGFGLARFFPAGLRRADFFFTGLLAWPAWP